MSIVSFAHAQKTGVSRQLSNAVYDVQGTSTAVNSDNENTGGDFVSSARVYAAERMVRDQSRNMVNSTEIALDVQIAIDNTKNIITYPNENN